MATLHICITCRQRPNETAANTSATDAAAMVDGQRLFDACVAAQAAHSDAVTTPFSIEPVRCLSACKRSCTAALSGFDRWTYVVGNLSSERDVAMLLDTAARYAATSDGLIPWSERPVHVRTNTIARIPPLVLPTVQNSRLSTASLPETA